MSTKFGIPPDEVYHFTLIKLFSLNGWLPFLHSQYGYFFLGEVTRTPYFFYHYVMSLPFHLFGSSINAYIFLRLINIAVAFGSLVLMSKIATQLKVTKLVKNLSLFMMANTLMFVFLSASVSYDNLFIIFTLGVVSLLLNLTDRFNITAFLGLMVLLVFGVMIKPNFIPIALVAALVIGVHFRLSLTEKITKQVNWKSNKLLNRVLLALLLLGSLLFVQRFVFNVVSYHAISPPCTKLHSIQQCSQSALLIRDNRLASAYQPPFLNCYQYLGQWSALMLKWTYGILATRNIEPTRFISIWSQILILLAIFATIRKYDVRNIRFNIVLGVIIFYSLALIYTNHSTYQKTGLVFLSVQGRYMFGLLPIFYIFANQFIFKLLRASYLKLAYILITILVFMTAGLPSYIVGSDAAWYTTHTTQINENLRSALREYRKILP